MISIYIWMFLKRKKCVLILENEEVTLNLFWWKGKSWQSTCKYLGVGFDKKAELEWKHQSYYQESEYKNVLPDEVEIFRC